jgi:hypothetical protein
MAEILEATRASTEQFFYAKLVEISSHNLDRMRCEWMEAWDCLIAINSTLRPADKAKIYRDWLTGFSRRRVEDVAYAFETARELAGVELRFSMGLATTDDQQAARAA